MTLSSGIVNYEISLVHFHSNADHSPKNVCNFLIFFTKKKKNKLVVPLLVRLSFVKMAHHFVVCCNRIDTISLIKFRGFSLVY